MAKKAKVVHIVATLPKGYKAPKKVDRLADEIQNVAELHPEWTKAKVVKVAKAILNDAKSPITISDIKEFIQQSRQDYGCDKQSVDEVWETASTDGLIEAGRQEGREEVLAELEDYLKRGN